MYRYCRQYLYSYMIVLVMPLAANIVMVIQPPSLGTLLFRLPGSGPLSTFLL